MDEFIDTIIVALGWFLVPFLIIAIFNYRKVLKSVGYLSLWLMLLYPLAEFIIWRFAQQLN